MSALGGQFFVQSGARMPGAGASRSRHNSQNSKLNLVSLMDIFTILVFFLMVNSGDVEVLQPDEAISLPSSHSTTRPGEAPVIKVSAEGIRLKGETLMAFDSRFGEFRYKRSQLAPSDPELVQPLYKALTALSKQQPQRADGDDKPLAITLMSDAGVPYETLKKILYTCAQANFRDVAMAVSQTGRSAPAQSEAAATTTTASIPSLLGQGV